MTDPASVPSAASLPAARPPGSAASSEQLRLGVIGPARYDINRSMTLKRRLLRDLTTTDAAAAYAALFSAERGPADIVTLPLVGLRDHARARGEAYHEVMPSRRLTLPMSHIVGQAPAADFDAHGRTLFVAAVRDATVVSRSNLVQVPDAFPLYFGYWKVRRRSKV